MIASSNASPPDRYSAIATGSPERARTCQGPSFRATSANAGIRKTQALRAVGQEANIQQGLMDIADEVVLPATSEAFSGWALAHRDLAATYGVFPDEFGSGT